LVILINGLRKKLDERKAFWEDRTRWPKVALTLVFILAYGLFLEVLGFLADHIFDHGFSIQSNRTPEMENCYCRCYAFGLRIIFSFSRLVRSRITQRLPGVLSVAGHSPSLFLLASWMRFTANKSLFLGYIPR